MLKKRPKKPIEYGITENFNVSTLRKAEEPTKIDILQSLNAETVGCFDVRTHVLETVVKPDWTIEDNPEWYYNYLRLNLDIYYSHKDAYIGYLVRLGYVPVCFLPTFITGINHSWFTQRLNALAIPYAQHAAQSFIYSQLKTATFDIWVSKMVAAEKLGKEPHMVLSKDIVEVLRNA